MRRMLAFVGVGVIAGGLLSHASADTFTVPGDFDSIQEAIDGVADGDQIRVDPGTYNEAINPGTKSIVIRGSTDLDGVPTTILNSAEVSAISIVNNSATGLVIENLEIHGNAYWSISRGGGVYCIDSRPTIRNCVFEACTAMKGSYKTGGGMYVLAHTTSFAPTVIDCVFRQNLAEDGGAIYFYRHTSQSEPVIMQVSGCLFEDNDGEDGGGAIFMYGQAGVALASCVFRNNLTGGFGGGIENASAHTSLYGCSLCAPDTGGYGQLISGAGWVDLGFNCLTADCTDTDGDDRPDHCDQCDGPDLDENGNGWADCAEVDNGDGTMTWNVRAGTQINPAVHIANAGDTVKLGAGEFHLEPSETINLSDKVIALSGESPQTTTLHSYGISAVRLIDNPNAGVLIEKMEIRGTSGFGVSRGGGIHCTDSRPTIRECVFQECEATAASYPYGGGIFILAQYSDLAPTIADCEFRQNLAGWGGAIYFYRHTSSSDPVTMQVSGCLFEDNEAPEGGGAIYMYGQAGMELSSCVFRTNRTGGFTEGGGIENASSLTSLYGCSLCAPDTAEYGQLIEGAGWADLGFNCLTHYCTDSDGDDRPDHCDQCDGPDVDSNGNGWADCAEVDNGDDTMTWHARAGTQIQPAVHISNEGDTIKLGPGVFNLELNESINLSNVGVRLCGTVDRSGAPETVINSFDASTIWMTNNSSEFLGVENLELHGNTFWSISRGGGMYCVDSGPTVLNCVFDACTAENGSYNYGGGLYVLAQETDLTPTLVGCVFKQCRAEWGGAIYLYKHTQSSGTAIMSISLCRFDENLAPDGGGAIYVYGSAGIEMEFCLLRMNASPQGDAGGIENVSAATTSIHASIFCAPTSDNYYRQHIDGTWADLGLNCFTDDCTDSDGDGIPDDCDFPDCPADLDGDGSIGGSDLAMILGAWGACSPGDDCLADLDDDGDVDGADLSLLLGGWGSCV